MRHVFTAGGGGNQPKSPHDTDLDAVDRRLADLGLGKPFLSATSCWLQCTISLISRGHCFYYDSYMVVITWAYHVVE